jgi:hypothetical protein
MFGIYENLTNQRTMDKKHERQPHNIAKKGFIGMRSFVARFNLSCALIENRRQSLSGHTATVKS